MHVRSFELLLMAAFSAPVITIAVLLIDYVLLRARRRLYMRLGKKAPRFTPSPISLGTALQTLQMFSRPSVAYIVAAKEEDEADEDDDGDPDHQATQLGPQLKRIRRGEPVERLKMRL